MHDTSVSSVPFARVSAAITHRKVARTTAGVAGTASSSLAGIP
jgi:hypothetical protein